MRVISLSVDGVAQAARRGLFDWLEHQAADVICLQDLRAREDQLDAQVYYPEGYQLYVCDTPEGRHNGVALYTRQMPRAVMMGLGFCPDIDLDGCYIRADFEQYSIVSLQVPQAQPSETSVAHKLRFLDHLQNHMQKISNKRRKYIFCGSWFMAGQKQDVQNWQQYTNAPGFMPEERHWLQELYNELGYVDAMRMVEQADTQYSWWPSGSVGEGDGWRVDMQVVSPELASYVQRARFYRDEVFSSHLPLIVDYDLDLY